MDSDTREQMQEQFISANSNIAVATNAFGMGIDRPDIRFVAHFEVPGSVEAYYQEAGRAGRDGQFATCDLLFNYADKRIQEMFLEGSNPPLPIIQGLYELLRDQANEQQEIHPPATISDNTLALVRTRWPYILHCPYSTEAKPSKG